MHISTASTYHEHKKKHLDRIEKPLYKRYKRNTSRVNATRPSSVPPNAL